MSFPGVSQPESNISRSHRDLEIEFSGHHRRYYKPFNDDRFWSVSHSHRNTWLYLLYYCTYLHRHRLAVLTFCWYYSRTDRLSKRSIAFSVLEVHTGRNLRDMTVGRSNIQSGRRRRFFKIYSVKFKKLTDWLMEFYEKDLKIVQMSIRYIRIYIFTVYLVTKN